MFHVCLSKIASLLFVLCLASITLAQSAEPSATENRLRFLRAFVVDERLNALRKEADLQSPVLRRVSLARPVYVIEAKTVKNGQAKFYRVAISRRTRGWIHEAAIAIPGRVGEDARLLDLITESYAEKENLTSITERLILCKLFSEKFVNSKFLPEVLLTLGQDAERIAALLNKTPPKHLNALQQAEKSTLKTAYLRADLRDIYLSDPRLDRYSRLGIHFEYLPKSNEFIYNGQAYQQIVRRFAKSAAYETANQRWLEIRQNLAQN